MGNFVKNIVFLVGIILILIGNVFGEFSWTALSSISNANVNATDPHVVIDISGNVTAVWIENGVIKASSRPASGSWSSISSLSTNSASNLLLGIDGSGNVTALWIENSQITSAMKLFGGNWGASTVVSLISGVSNPSLAVDQQGNAVAVWSRGGVVESSTRSANVWSPAFTLVTSNASHPHVAINNSGTAIAVWHRIVSGTDVIASNNLTLSTNTWGVAKNVFSGTAAFFHDYPKVAIDSNGNATLAWFRYNLLNGNAYQNVQVLTSSLTSGAAAWSIPTMLSNSGIRNPGDLTLKIGFDTNDDTIAVWTNSYDGEVFYIESSQKPFGGSWQPFKTPAPPSLYSFGMDLSIAGGSALLTNMAWDGSTVAIHSQQTDCTNPLLQGWTYINPISTGNYNGYPQCDVSLNGATLKAAVVWLHFDGTYQLVQAAIGSDSVIDPPSNLSGDQSVIPLGIYNDYINTIHWQASSSPNLIQYNIFRNGEFCGSTSPSTLEFIDHNTVQGQSVTYGVAALTSNFRQSQIVYYVLNP